jgi:dienelactone hydrolase
MRDRSQFSWMNLMRGALAVCALGLGHLQAQPVVTDFKAGQTSGEYAFTSHTTQTFPDLVKSGASGDAVNIVGHLFLPKGDGKVPMVLLMHGSGGIYSAMLDFWPKLLNAEGIGVFALDRFSPRGVTSTAEDQSLVPFAADVTDAFAALRLLASHPRVDANHIAIMGFSRGGIAAWRAAVERIIAAQQMPDRLRFAAHIMMYSGGCSGGFRLIVKPGVFSKAPQLWVHGDADDYCPIGAVRDYSQRIGAAGTPVEFVTLPGAYHKFDQDDQRHINLPKVTRTLDDCPLELDIDTLITYDHSTGQRLTGPAYQKALKECGALGASVQGDKAARKKAGEATVAFLHKVFGM